MVSDPLWPFENSSVPTVVGFGRELDLYTLSFVFDNPGGLPAGGSVAIVDVELINTSVSVLGLVDGLAVPVLWSPAFYTVAGDNSLPPIWDAPTNTLFGAGGPQFPTLNNFAFFTTDIALDEIRFDIRGARGDGIGFAVSAATVPAIPEPGSLVLLGLGLVGLGFGRSRH